MRDEARAIATRCCIPPESCHGYFVPTPSSPISRRTASARATCSSDREPARGAAGNMTLRMTVSHGNSERL